jgi:hypothetical protein
LNEKTVNGLWIGGVLSPLEILTIKSFQAHGYRFVLWHYHPLENVPNGTFLKDGNSILPESAVFSYHNANKFGHGKGSFAGFSDIFRYKLLYENGGIWVDMDVTCLGIPEYKSEYVFRFHHQSGVVGNYMQCPARSELMAWCYDKAVSSMNAQNEDWMLPIRILYQGIKMFTLDKYIQDFSNPDSFPVVSKMIVSKKALPQHWRIIHWMNEEFRRIGIPKHQVVEGSQLCELMQRYHINVEVLSGSKKRVYLKKLSRWNYIYLSILSRVKYIFQKRQP